MSAAQVNEAVSAFSTCYVNDWDWWLTVPIARRPQVLGQILRRWKATRPLTMRRTRSDGLHPPPYLEDLYAAALDPVRALDDLTVATIAHRSNRQDDALRSLWNGFSGLTTTRSASCVGISKAILLVTDGRIGPALDSQVQARLGIKPPTTSDGWLATLGQVANDIAAFEARSGRLEDAAPERFGHLNVGRLYDMALGPREPGS
jgi:hypothetical protein